MLTPQHVAAHPTSLLKADTSIGYHLVRYPLVLASSVAVQHTFVNRNSAPTVRSACQLPARAIVPWPCRSRPLPPGATTCSSAQSCRCPQAPLVELIGRLDPPRHTLCVGIIRHQSPVGVTTTSPPQDSCCIAVGPSPPLRYRIAAHRLLFPAPATVVTATVTAHVRRAFPFQNRCSLPSAPELAVHTLALGGRPSPSTPPSVTVMVPSYIPMV